MGSDIIMTKPAKGGDNASLWLIIWTANNIGVTLLNKMAFKNVNFHYPYMLSAIHMITNYLGSLVVFFLLQNYYSTNGNVYLAKVGSSIVSVLGNIHRKEIDWRIRRKLIAFSLIFSMNIAIGNVSLKHVSVNFNQVMRSLVPAITILLDNVMFGRPTSLSKKLAVIPVIFGVACACYGDLEFTTIGFIYTIMCIILASLKVVVSGEMLQGEAKLHPVDLLGHMAPLAAVQCLVVSFFTGEVSSIMSRWESELSPLTVSSWPATVVIGSGVFAFSLNICSLMANKVTSPLTLCITANVKQVLMIALATIVFHTPVSLLNGTGIFIVLCGSARYSYVSLLEKQDKSKALASTSGDKSKLGLNDDDDYKDEESQNNVSDTKKQVEMQPLNNMKTRVGLSSPKQTLASR